MALSNSNLSSTKDTQNCFTTYSLANLHPALNAAFGHTFPVFSSKGSPLFLPDRRNPIRFSSDHQTRELPKHHPVLVTDTLSRGDRCRRVSHAQYDDQRADDIHSRRDTFSPSPADILRKVLIVTIWFIIWFLGQSTRLTTQTPPLFMSLSGRSEGPIQDVHLPTNTP